MPLRKLNIWCGLTDSLGLMNRNQLPDHIDKQMGELSEDDKCAVLLVNLDRFKQVNDALGHSKGDILLRNVAQRLSQLSKGMGQCARYGGDEFAIVIREKRSLDLAAHLADLDLRFFHQAVPTWRAKRHFGMHDRYCAEQSGERHGRTNC